MWQPFGGKFGANLVLYLLVCVGVLKYIFAILFGFVCAVEALEEKLWHAFCFILLLERASYFH